jgi:hypothetical protein
MGLELRRLIVQPVGSRYTDYYTTALICSENFCIIYNLKVTACNYGLNATIILLKIPNRFCVAFGWHAKENAQSK